MIFHKNETELNWVDSNTWQWWKEKLPTTTTWQHYTELLNPFHPGSANPQSSRHWVQTSNFLKSWQPGSRFRGITLHLLSKKFSLIKTPIKIHILSVLRFVLYFHFSVSADPSTDLPLPSIFQPGAFASTHSTQFWLVNGSHSSPGGSKWYQALGGFGKLLSIAPHICQRLSQ